MNLTGRLTLVLSGCISVARIMVLQMKEVFYKQNWLRFLFHVLKDLKSLNDVLSKT